CGKDDPDLKEEMEKQFVDLLSEELKLQETVGDEHMRHMNITFGEARRVAAQYQKEAEKCNTATETCEQAREQAEALMRQEKKITSLWEKRARQLVKFDPSVSIFRYHINVTRPDDESSGSRPIRKSLLRLIYIELCNMHSSSFPLHSTAYDGGSYIFTLKALTFEKPSSFVVDLHGQRYACILSSERSQCSDQERSFRGKDFCYRREDDPHCGVAPFRGLRQSLMATRNGLALCADHSAIPFRKNMCVLDFLIEYIPEIQDTSGISRFRDRVHMALRGLRVGVTHRPTKGETYIISGLTESMTYNLYFELKDHTGKKEGIYLTEYYRRKWNRDIVHRGIPCLKLGRGKKPNYVPMEFCVLINDTSFPKEKLATEASRKLKEVSLLGTDVRRSEISRMFHDEYAICSRGHSAKVLESFKVEAAKRWALINCSWANGENKLNNVEAFIQKLRDCCTCKEVEMENPLVVREACMGELSSLSNGHLAVVGSVNPPSATRYTARVSLQSPGKEEIVNFGHMCLELVNAYGQMNGMKPKKIVVFRDRPFWTNWNKQAYTLHCMTVIWDENGFSSDEMQKLIYHLSYLFARCSKPVSLVPPVYYAHLAAYRGQMLQEVAWLTQSSAVKVADFLKDSMFFI
ncbi:argonaute 2-like protein, partial [Tanacetum coccineum]